MSAPNTNKDQVDLALTECQVEKLKLEIENLKKPKKYTELSTKLVPLVSTVIAVGGFIFGVVQYERQVQSVQQTARTEQLIKVRAQISSDVDQILRFPSDNTQTATRAGALLEDLDLLLHLESDLDGGGANGIEWAKRKISVRLSSEVEGDCNLNVPRQVQFVIAIIDHWPDYTHYLKTKPIVVENILSRYIDALVELNGKNPKYFSKLKSKIETDFDEPEGSSSLRPTLRHFEDILTSFKDHLNMLKEDSGVTRSRYVKYFQASICNRELTQQEFNFSFDPKSDSTVFADCLRSTKIKRRPH
jgi:hypothetical protein